MLAASIAILALAAIGHAMLWIGVINRWHGTGFPRAVVKSTTALFYLALVGIPVVMAWPREPLPPSDARWDWSTAYMTLCAFYGLIQIPRWLLTRFARGVLPPGVVAVSRQQIDVCEKIGAAPTSSPRTRLFCRFPFNELWQLEVSEFEVPLANLPPALDGLSICHISDLHFSHRIDRAYYEEVARQTNALGCDLVALTGDICDKADRIDWVPDTLGRMTAPLGKFAILGNHDLRTRDIERLRESIRSSGFVDVSESVETLTDAALVIAGNERPWIKTPEIGPLPADRLKLLLSHSPDQYGWARRHGFDLMLAGHTHGGQVCFPLIGPVICPSWHGTKYASGFFDDRPTLLHVSRGTASLFPYRWNCRPEITKLVLRRAV